MSVFQDLDRAFSTPVLGDLRGALLRQINERISLTRQKGIADKDAIRTAEDLLVRQKAVREWFLDSIGGIPERLKDHNAKTVKHLEEETFTVDSIIFESAKDVFVTGLFYLPKERKGKIPAVLMVCGHSTIESKQADRYEVVQKTLATNGFAVLAVDPPGQGERREYPDTNMPHCVAEHSYENYRCLALGDNLARYIIRDNMSAVDYLLSREEIDGSKIGITGNSGGGTQTTMMILADERLAAAAPGTFITSQYDIIRSGMAQDGEQIWRGMLEHGFDHEDALLSFAPRPLAILGAEYDFFPPEGTQRTYERLKKYWALHGKEDNLALFWSPTPHQYSAMLAARATEFFLRTLCGQQRTVDNSMIEAYEPELLNCTKSGTLYTDDPTIKTVFLQIRERYDTIQRQTSQQQAEEWVRERVFFGREPSERPYLKLNPASRAEGLLYERMIWCAEKERWIHGVLFRSEERAGQALPLVVAVWNGGTGKVSEHEQFLKERCAAGYAVLVVDLALDGLGHPLPLHAEGADATHGTGYFTASLLLLLGDSAAAIKTYDLYCASLLAGQCPGIDKTRPVTLYAHGKWSLFAALAAMLNKNIKEVQTEGTPFDPEELLRNRLYDSTSAYEWVLPGMARYLTCEILYQKGETNENHRIQNQ